LIDLKVCQVSDILPVIRDDDIKGTSPESKLVMELEDAPIFVFLFQIYITPGNPKVHTAISNTDNNVPWSLENDFNIGQKLDPGDILPGIGVVDRETRIGQQAFTSICQQTLAGKCDSDLAWLFFHLAPYIKKRFPIGKRLLGLQ